MMLFLQVAAKWDNINSVLIDDFIGTRGPGGGAGYKVPALT